MPIIARSQWVEDFGPVRAFVHTAPRLVHLAREAREDAVSYRGFKVGAAALVTNVDGEIRIFDGANYKLRKDDETICAEKSVLNKVIKNKFDRVIAMVVSGPIQPDRHSGLELPTLHPCGDCRTLLSVAPQVQDNTFIMPVHPTLDTYELYSRREITAIHAAGDSEDAPDEFMYYTDPGFQIWERGKEDYDALFNKPMPEALSSFSLFQLARLAVTNSLRPLLI
ncbi:MAG TPA: hypothetical protein VFN56_02420 [Candidatus Saccharimonadales bacterium]|nr:hypothetical protein [Candidatus Saccharimonadales bacterium]